MVYYLLKGVGAEINPQSTDISSWLAPWITDEQFL